jgi:redox-sensitive bicupin YhaK (pirin superfamily)
LYVIEGEIRIGDDEQILRSNQIGWLDRGEAGAISDISVLAGNVGARAVLYAGEPQHDEIVSYGPFISDHQDEIKGLYNDFRHGKMKHVSTLGDGQRFHY